MAISHAAQRWWTLAQAIMWCVGFALIVTLVLFPVIGLHAFWDVLIPVAPAVVALIPGIWRNVCPLGITSQLPRRLGFSRLIHLNTTGQGWLSFAAVALLFLIIPLRHTTFDTNGLSTAILLVAIGCLALIMGSILEGKSGWCAGLCPVHQVEKLYGQHPTCTVDNPHCSTCSKCVSACPDSTPGVNPHTAERSWPKRWAILVFIGAFPGYIWGWFQTPDYLGTDGLANLMGTYLLPAAGGGATLALYVLLISSMPMQRRRNIDRLFAAVAISTYYWFRVPALLGYGPFPGDGMLIDLTGSIPAPAFWAFRVVSTAFWVWWIAMRNNGLRPWMIRPPFEQPSGVLLTLSVSATLNSGEPVRRQTPSCKPD